MLELSGNSGIPSQANIGMREIIKWMGLQAKGHESHLLVRKHQNRGSFLVQTNKQETADFLKTFQLEVNWGGKTYKVPLQPALPNKPRFWVKMINTCEGDFYNEDDRMFDKMLESAGFIIVTPTSKNRHFSSKIENGTRSAQVIRGDQHIGREHVWYDGKGQGYKWYLQYNGQPHRCTRGCNIFHEDGKCDIWEKQKERKSWEGQQKVFFVSSSLLKHASDTKLTRVDAIPGAKIGHVSNHVNNDATIFKQADALIIHAGANMDMGSVETSKPHIEYQTEELGKVLGELVEHKKKVFIVDPICGQWVKEAPGADHWAILRSRLKKLAKKTKSEWVSLDAIKWVAEEDVAADGVHYSLSGTQKVLEAIATRVKEVTGMEIMEGMTIQERPYSGISRNHYRVGCHRCTRHHDGRQCPPLPVCENADLNNSSSSNTDNNNSSTDNNNTIQESFMSADSEGFNAAHDISEEITETSAELSEASSPLFKGADATDDDDDATKLLPVHIESPDLTASPYTVSLRNSTRSTSRSTSAKKRELEKSNGSPTDVNGKKQCTKSGSQSPKGRTSRTGNQKQSKK